MIPHREVLACGFIIIVNLFACVHGNAARTYPCAFSLPFTLACMTGKMSYKQIKIETQKRANYNMFNYLFWNHSSSLLYSVPGNVHSAIWQGHLFFSPSFNPFSWVVGWSKRQDLGRSHIEGPDNSGCINWRSKRPTLFWSLFNSLHKEFSFH